MLSSDAVFTADPTAIPRSAIFTTQFGPLNGIPAISRERNSSDIASHDGNPHPWQFTPTGSFPLAPISRHASADSIFFASRRKNARSYSSPNSRIASASRLRSFPLTPDIARESTPFPFGAVLAERAIKERTYPVASCSTFMAYIIIVEIKCLFIREGSPRACPALGRDTSGKDYLKSVL